MWKKDSSTFEYRVAFKIATVRMDTDHRFPALFPLLLILLIFSSCRQSYKRPQVITRSYYYWRNATYLSGAESTILKKHHVQRLYAKLLDIDWDEDYHAYPAYISHVEELANNMIRNNALSMEVVPVIFITNKTFAKIDSAEIPELAVRILRKCFEKYDSVDRNNESYYYQWYHFKPAELQFDCDWTVSTAGKYFYFLRKIKELLPAGKTALSATIRLHQFRYPDKTGVPPVDRGMLMMYNVNNLKQYSETNSIFDMDKASPYFARKEKYPLPLDIALAAYSWGVVYRDKKFYQLENGMNADTLNKCRFLKPAANHFYKVIKDTVFFDMYLRPGDEIKIEGSEEIEKAARLALKAINSDSVNIALFELSETEYKNLSHEKIEEVYNSF